MAEREREWPTADALAAQVGAGVLDTDLAALLSVLVEHGVPLVVASRGPEAASALRAALTRSAGGVLLADSLEEVLRLSGAAPGTVPDELRDMGLVLVLRAVDAAPRLVAAHYIRRLERDAGGHIQRRPPAVLAAWNERDGRLEHFYWSITADLADHAGLSLADFERERRSRAARMAHAGHAR